jgi:hypothetical protein
MISPDFSPASGVGFSLWRLDIARTKTRRLKPTLLNKVAQVRADRIKVKRLQTV